MFVRAAIHLSLTPRPSYFHKRKAPAALCLWGFIVKTSRELSERVETKPNGKKKFATRRDLSVSREFFTKTQHNARVPPGARGVAANFHNYLIMSSSEFANVLCQQVLQGTQNTGTRLPRRAIVARARAGQIFAE